MVFKKFNKLIKVSVFLCGSASIKAHMSESKDHALSFAIFLILFNSK